ncbi:MAG: MFS transporter [Actinomycetota bacterium]
MASRATSAPSAPSAPSGSTRTSGTDAGIRANLPQFVLLVGVNALVGALVGQERTLVPLLGDQVFLVRSATSTLAFIATFGLAKALANLAAGALADRVGRKPVLVVGWLVALPVAPLLIWAPAWGWVVAANLLLGVNQGLTWSTTVIMKIDLAGPRRRGLAMGLNEAAGYGALAASAWVSGVLAARVGLRSELFLIGLAITLTALALSAVAVRETWTGPPEGTGASAQSLGEMLRRAAGRDRRLAVLCRTGLVNNANDAHAWGLLPVLMVREGLGPAQIGLVAGIYPVTWALAQLVTGALSDRIGRRVPISAGMGVQALALGWLAVGNGLSARAAAGALLGLGTALTYPTLIAAVADRAAPSWRAMAVGAYRLWRDGGYVAGALLAGVVADLFDLRIALAVIAALTAISGLDAWINIAPDRRRRGEEGIAP